MIIFYHRADYDGIGSGVILKEIFPKATLVAADYPDPVEPLLNMIMPGESVIFADYTMEPIEIMVELAKTHPVTIIDHHTTIIEYCKNNPDHPFWEVWFPTAPDESAAMLCWKYGLHHNLLGYYPEAPRALWLISMFDTWQHKNDPDILAFMLGLFGADYKLDSPGWKTLLFFNYHNDDSFNQQDDLVEEIIKAGKIIQKSEDAFAQHAVEAGAFELELQGRKLIAMNTNKRGSLQFKSLVKEYDGFMVFTLLNNGWWRYSVYCDPSKADSVRCDLIANTYGGGGHKGAAGFQTKELLPDILEASKKLQIN